ncbi:hypothetical protein QTN25_003064 [Entamoeba marina]
MYLEISFITCLVSSLNDIGLQQQQNNIERKELGNACKDNNSEKHHELLTNLGKRESEIHDVQPTKQQIINYFQSIKQPIVVEDININDNYYVICSTENSSRYINRGGLFTKDKLYFITTYDDIHHLTSIEKIFAREDIALATHKITDPIELFYETILQSQKQNEQK